MYYYYSNSYNGPALIQNNRSDRLHHVMVGLWFIYVPKATWHQHLNPSYTRGGQVDPPKVFLQLWIGISFENEILAHLTSIMTG